MNNLVVAVVIVVVIIIVYLVMAKNADSLFISSVDTAAKSCDAAIASQNEADFSTAIADIAAAKSARSASLNQYAPVLVGGPAIPDEVSAASTKLDGLICSNHTLDNVAVNAISTATAACNALSTSKSPENIATAKATKAAAKSAISAAVAQYSSGQAYVTKALSASIAAYNALSCPILPQVVRIDVTKTGGDPTISIAEFDVFDENGKALPKSSLVPSFDKYTTYNYNGSIVDGDYTSNNVLSGHKGFLDVGSGKFSVSIPPTYVSKVAMTHRVGWNGRTIGSVINLIAADGSVVASATVKESDLADYPTPLLNTDGKQVQWYLVNMSA